MQKWKTLCNLERDFEKCDKKWEHTQYFVYQDFKFPDDQFSINLEDNREYVRTIGHYIDKWKFEALMEPGKIESLRTKEAIEKNEERMKKLEDLEN